VSITVLEGGSRTNVVPGIARAQLDARLLPGERCEDFARALGRVVGDPEVQFETLLAFPSRSSPTESDLFRAIGRVAQRTEPGALVLPRMIGGFTDAHWFRDRGIVAYGFVPRRLAPADTRGIHGVDERVSVANLQTGIETLVAIIEELAAPESRAQAR